MFDPIKCVYSSAKQRCTNPKNKSYVDYGGRGIQFRFSSLKEFKACLGERPIGATVDRIDNNGHYEVGNVRWASRAEQVKNRRMMKSNTSGVEGVHLYKCFSKGKEYSYWRARGLDLFGKRIILYSGASFKEAVEAITFYKELKC